MPGSRPEEIIRILPRMNKISKKLTGEYGFNVRLVCSDVADTEIYRKYYDDPKGEFIFSEKDSNLKAIADSDFVITKFGTSNLECGLLGIPFCAVYRAGFINYIIARMLLKIKYVSLVNIIFNREIVKEFIQYNFTEENIIDEILRVKDNDEYRKRLLSNLSNLWNYFEVNKQDASKLILNEIK
jgi:lipid-A-disaccharide synthase